jgi:ribulose-5-phosphate 4-epimerase/fuculose-1-phosphate aldolase
VSDAAAEGLVALGRRVVAAGLVVASGGNLAVRLADQDRILVTPRGWALDDLDPAVLVTVGLDGRHISGAYAPTTELALHRAAFEVRSDAAVCLHLHPPMATLLTPRVCRSGASPPTTPTTCAGSGRCRSSSQGPMSWPGWWRLSWPTPTSS